MAKKVLRILWEMTYNRWVIFAKCLLNLGLTDKRVMDKEEIKVNIAFEILESSVYSLGTRVISVSKVLDILDRHLSDKEDTDESKTES